MDIPNPPLISPGSLGTRFIQDDWRGTYDRRNKLLLMEGRRPDAVFIGDSLTGDWPLEESFGDLFPICLNRGIGGDTARQVTLRLEADCLQLRPVRVIFMIGTNDIAARFGYDEDQTILQDFDTHYRRSFALLRVSGARVAIGAIPPTRQYWQVDRMFERKRVLIPTVNRMLVALAREYGFDFLDFSTPLEESTGVLRADLTMDGCHLTASGYYLLNRVVRTLAG